MIKIIKFFFSLSNVKIRFLTHFKPFLSDIIEDYDTDKLFPVYGFGARLPPEGKISHMFPCNFQPENPFMDRVEGVLSCYKNCLPRIQLYGPTNFAPIIREVARMARSPENIEKR